MAAAEAAITVGAAPDFDIRPSASARIATTSGCVLSARYSRDDARCIGPKKSASTPSTALMSSMWARPVDDSTWWKRPGDDRIGQAHESCTPVSASQCRCSKTFGDAATQRRGGRSDEAVDETAIDRCQVCRTFDECPGDVACGDRWCERCVLPGRVGDDVANLGAVRGPGEQRIDAVRAESRASTSWHTSTSRGFPHA